MLEEPENTIREGFSPTYQQAKLRSKELTYNGLTIFLQMISLVIHIAGRWCNFRINKDLKKPPPSQSYPQRCPQKYYKKQNETTDKIRDFIGRHPGKMITLPNVITITGPNRKVKRKIFAEATD